MIPATARKPAAPRRPEPVQRVVARRIGGKTWIGLAWIGLVVRTDAASAVSTRVAGSRDLPRTAGHRVRVTHENEVRAEDVIGVSLHEGERGSKNGYQETKALTND